jgi:hypothetical protein
MTVESIYGPVSYSGNGVTVAFAFPFQFFAPSDLIVRLFDLSTHTDIAPVLLLNGAAAFDYQVTGTIDDEGTGEYLNGTVTFNTAPPANYQITIERSVAALQSVSLADDSLFPAKSVEAELDRLQMQIQQGTALQARAITAPASDGPVDLILPPAAARADMVLSFDDGGNVETVISKGAVQAAIAALDAGIAPAPATASWATSLAAALVLYAAPVIVADGQAMVVSGRNAVHDGYEGTFIYKAADTVSTFPQSGRGFVDASGRRWFRDYPKGLVNALWYGARGDGATDDWAALDACWQDAIGQNQSGIFVPTGTYALSRPLNINNASLIGASEVGTAFMPLATTAGDAVLYADASRAGGGGTDARYTNFRILGNRAALSAPVAGLKLIGNVLYCTFQNIRIEECSGASVLLDATLPGPERPTAITFINVHVSACTSHGWYFKAGRNITMLDCASEGIGGNGVHFSGETEALSKIENARMYLENIAGDGIFLGDGDEFRTISPLVHGYGSEAAPNYGYRVDGAVSTDRTYLYGGDFTKNPTPLLRDPLRSTNGRANAGSMDVRFASGDTHVVENGYIAPGQLQILGNRSVQIRGNRFVTPVSSYPMTFTNGDGVLATNTTTFLGPFSGAQDVVENSVRQWVTGYVTLAAMRAESDVLPGGTFQYQVQIFVDTLPTALLCTLTNAGGGVSTDIVNQVLVSPNSFITCRVLTDNGAAPIPQRGIHVTVSMRT